MKPKLIKLLTGKINVAFCRCRIPSLVSGDASVAKYSHQQGTQSSGDSDETSEIDFDTGSCSERAL